MKAKFVIILIIWVAFPLFLAAQSIPYRSYFGNEFTRWYTYHSYFDIGYSELYSVMEKQDTILSNGVNYKKLNSISFPNDGSNGVYYFGIREEPETGSLYINKDGDSEILVSRMNLEIGDKFYFSPDSSFIKYYYFDSLRYDENGSYSVVDSIYYDNNRKYIQFEAVYHSFFYDTQLTFIEGIGPNISFDPIIGDHRWDAINFNCYETENELWKSKNFHGGYNGECLFNWSGIPQIHTDIPLKLIQRKGEIELQPDVADFKSGRVYMYSMDGKLIYMKSTQGNTSIIIITSGFPQGAYIIQLTDKKTKKNWYKKIVL